MIRHYVFIEAISKLREGTPEWEVIVAGYLVMGLCDAWHQLEPVDLIIDQSFDNITQRVDAIKSHYRVEQNALQKILRTLVAIPCMSHPCYIANSLLEYGAALEREVRWSLASDVYRTVAEVLEGDARAKKADLSMASYARRREGFCLRNVSEYRGAQSAYAKSFELAITASDEIARLYAKCGHANVLRTRGNIPGAIEAFDELFVDVGSCGFDASVIFRPLLLHFRAILQYDQGRYTEALPNLAKAYHLSNDSSLKENILTDFAACSAEAGLYGNAHTILRTLLATSSQPLIHQLVIANLIEIETVFDNKAEVIRLTSAWQPELCTPMINASVRFAIAKSVKKFGTPKQARDAFVDTVDFAAQAGIHRVQFAAMREGNIK